jgi:hypothetical protein
MHALWDSKNWARFESSPRTTDPPKNNTIQYIFLILSV